MDINIYAKWLSCLVIVRSVEGLRARSLYGWSNSTARPYCMTKIRSASMIVAKRWAMIRTVQPPNSSFSLVWIKLSVSRSILAVASSRTKILVFLIIARPRHTSCFCPTENRLFDSEQYVFMPSSRVEILSKSEMSFVIYSISLSLTSLNGSRFSRIVP